MNSVNNSVVGSFGDANAVAGEAWTDSATLELQLLTRTASGDRAAFEALVARFDVPLDRFLRRFLPPEAACEVRNTTFLRVYQHAKELRGNSVKSWIYRIAWRCACSERLKLVNGADPALRAMQSGSGDFERTAARGAQTDGGPGQDLDAYPGSQPEPQTLLMADEERDGVRDAMATLEAGDRALVWICIVESMPLEEAARILQKPPSTLRYRLGKALAAVRAHLEKSGVARPESSTRAAGSAGFVETTIANSKGRLDIAGRAGAAAQNDYS